MSGSFNVSGRPRRVAVLGSTGSIGTQTLDVIRRHPDKLQVVALAAGTRAAELLDQAREFNVGYCVANAALRAPVRFEHFEPENVKNPELLKFLEERVIAK